MIMPPVMSLEACITCCAVGCGLPFGGCVRSCMYFVACASVGGFDTGMKVGEDWDFCYRIARQFEVRFVREPLVNYRSHSSAAHKNVAEMERGMERFYKKAFETNDRSVLDLRRRAYGIFHKVMAGSYFHSREYGQFARHAGRSIFMRWQNLGYFLKFPLRRFLSSKNQTHSSSI